MAEDTDKARRRQDLRNAAHRRRRLANLFDCVCIVCGTAFKAQTPSAVSCSTPCTSAVKSARLKGRPTGRKKPVQARLPLHSQPGPLKAALQSGDNAAVIRAVLLRCSTQANGCNEWTGPVTRDGYPRRSLHRIVAEATHGPLHGEPVHHVCANRRCLNPDHLVPVTQRENAAEMLERGFYRTRIATLEAALRSVDPTHPLLR